MQLTVLSPSHMLMYLRAGPLNLEICKDGSSVSVTVSRLDQSGSSVSVSMEIIHDGPTTMELSSASGVSLDLSSSQKMEGNVDVERVPLSETAGVLVTPWSGN